MLKSRTAFLIAYRFLIQYFTDEATYRICKVKNLEELKDLLDSMGSEESINDIRSTFIFANWMAGFSGFELINRKTKKEKAS